jgi:voltage-gated potassium channel Kch
MSLLARLLRSAPPIPAAADKPRRRDPGELTNRGWSVRSARRWFVRLLADYRWYILVFAGLVAFILGCIGWWQFFTHPIPPAQPRQPRPSDIVYWSFKDFLSNSPSAVGLPWELDVARYLAPIVFGWAGLSALGLLFRDRVQQMRIPLMRGHVVMCGLGSYVGIAFLRHLREKRIPVVVIELDATNPNIGLCRSLGVPVIVGDAQRLKTLQAAGAHRASRVLAVSADDAVNTQIVATWREVPGRRAHQPGCLARISDPGFSVLLWIQEVQRGDPELSVDYFNIDEISARLLLEEVPLDTQHGQPHILVAHLDPLGIWLVFHAARTWHDARGDNPDKLVITVVDQKPQERIDALHGLHPALEQVCDFIPFSTITQHIGELPDHHRDQKAPPLSCAYVTAYHDKEAFETALKLRHALPAASQVVVALSRPHGVAGLLGDVTEAKAAGPLANIEVFPTMDNTCTAELVQGGSFETMARAIHERWRQEQIKAARPATTWENLDESRRQSSRAQARDIPVKLRMINCAITPLRRWDAKNFKFTDQEVEELAVEEHDRWNSERIADGWTLIDMPQADDPEEAKRLLESARRRKQTPYLLPWQDLVETYPDVAQLDRVFVRAIPKILASAGMQIVRTDQPTLTGSAQTAPW